MTKILVPVRRSYVCPGDISRSLQERVLNPLKHGNYFEVTTVNEDESLFLVGDFDVVYLNRIKSQIGFRFVEECRKKGKKIIYDLDDLITHFPKNNIAGWDSEDIVRAIEIMKMSDIVICSNQEIQKKITETGIRRTRVLRTALEISFPRRDLSNSKKIVWINGDNLKFQNFKNDFFKAINQFLAEFPSYELHVYADTDQEFNGKIPYIFHSAIPHSQFFKAVWDENFEFAISPLGGAEEIENSNFYECKTAIKYLIFGGLSIPCIYSNSKIYEDVIDHRKNGLLVKNNFESWLTGLRQMASDKVLRENIIRDAYSGVIMDFNIDDISKEQKEIIESV